MHPHQPSKTCLPPKHRDKWRGWVTHVRIDENPVKGGYTISALTRHATETASQNTLRWKSENDSSEGLGRSVMSRCGIRQQIRFVLILFSLWKYMETYFAEPDTTLGVYKLL